MEEEGKTEKQKETKEDRYSLLKLCLKGSMNRPSELQEIMTGALRAAYLNKKNPEVQNEAIALIEGLEQLFDDENIKFDVFRGILRLAYRVVDQCISQDTAREPSPATPQKLPAFIPLMLKKIIQGWDAEMKRDAEMKPVSGSSCLSDPKNWEMHPDAWECFDLMIDAYRLGVAKSPIPGAINKEIDNIFKEHLEGGHSYWRYIPNALIKWIVSVDTPNHVAIMLAKARTRFLFSDYVFAELKYLSDLGYYDASEEQKTFILRLVQSRQKMNLLADKLTEYLRKEWVEEVGSDPDIHWLPMISSFSSQTGTLIDAAFHPLRLVQNAHLAPYIDKLHAEIKAQRAKIFVTSSGYVNTMKLKCKIGPMDFNDNIGLGGRSIIIDCWTDDRTIA